MSAPQILVPKGTRGPYSTEDVLLYEDASTTLVTAVYLLPPSHFDLDRMVQLAFYQELTRALLAVACQPASIVLETDPVLTDPIRQADRERETAALNDLYAFVTQSALGQAKPPPPGTRPRGAWSEPIAHCSHHRGPASPFSGMCGVGLWMTVRTALLPFLRTTALLLFAHFDISVRRRLRHHVYGTAASPHAPCELDKLLAYAALPALADVARVLDVRGDGTSNGDGAYGGAAAFKPLIQGWCAQWHAFVHAQANSDQLVANAAFAPTLAYPHVYTFTRLPKRFDVLLRLSTDASCSRCHSTREELAICLICGVYICATKVCLNMEQGLVMHTDTYVRLLQAVLSGLQLTGRFWGDLCSVLVRARQHAGLGVYLLDKQCVVAVIHDQAVIYQRAPYMDEHGESDPGLRYGAHASARAFAR